MSPEKDAVAAYRALLTFAEPHYDENGNRDGDAVPAGVIRDGIEAALTRDLSPGPGDAS